MQRPVWDADEHYGEKIGSKAWAVHVMFYYLRGDEPVYINEIEVAGGILAGRITIKQAQDLLRGQG